MSGFRGKAPLLIAVLVGVISGNYIFQPIIQEAARNNDLIPKENKKEEGNQRIEIIKTKANVNSDQNEAQTQSKSTEK
ncbi:hypothetical protein K502DRAFT_323324 [Neoconidiobolus thromboides FSU 785]|nr:hypothetical protein K502DRAFT_323324 [Neoconidiobolus thromboides FSU 785]